MRFEGRRDYKTLGIEAPSAFLSVADQPQCRSLSRRLLHGPESSTPRRHPYSARLRGRTGEWAECAMHRVVWRMIRRRAKAADIDAQM
jgi:hypothetical protein